MPTKEIATALPPLSPQQQQMLRETLQSVLGSAEFCKSNRYPMLLKYIVRNTLDGNLDGLKERVIGAKVFGRPIGYDPGVDAIVRTTAGEVRRRMAVYFSEHPESPVRIELPVGRYAAEFHFRSQISSETRPDHPLEKSVAGNHPAVYAATPQSETNLPQRRVTTYFFLAAAVALLTVGAVGLASYLHDRDHREFWSPVFHNDAPALIVLGRNPKDRAGGPFNNQAGGHLGVDDPQSNTALGNAMTAARICSIFQDYKRECDIAPMQTATLGDLRNKSVVLVGGLDNAWTLRLLAPFRYQFVVEGSDPTAPTARLIVDQYHRGSNATWKDSSNAPRLTTDYAIVTRFHSDITDGAVVIAAGISQLGTIKAGEYLASPEKLRGLIDLAPKGWNGFNFEAVLQIDVVQGSPGHVKVIATQFW